mgnify:CR=1 FL=1
MPKCSNDEKSILGFNSPLKCCGFTFIKLAKNVAIALMNFCSIDNLALNKNTMILFRHFFKNKIKANKKLTLS